MVATRAQQQWEEQPEEQQEEKQCTHQERQLEERDHVFDILNFSDEAVEVMNQQNTNNLQDSSQQGGTFMMVWHPPHQCLRVLAILV